MSNNEQIENIMKVTGLEKAEVVEIYDRLVQRFPVGHVTESDFCKQFHDEELFSKARVYPSKALFHAADRNKSGNIELDEYIIALTCLTNPIDTKFISECLFKMFDKDGKGSIDRQDLISTLIGLSDDDNEAEEIAKIERQADEILQEKRVLTEADFQQLTLENDELESMARRFMSVFMVGMAFSDEDFE